MPSMKGFSAGQPKAIGSNIPNTQIVQFKPLDCECIKTVSFQNNMIMFLFTSRLL